MWLAAVPASSLVSSWPACSPTARPPSAPCHPICTAQLCGSLSRINSTASHLAEQYRRIAVHLRIAMTSQPPDCSNQFSFFLHCFISKYAPSAVNLFLDVWKICTSTLRFTLTSVLLHMAEQPTDCSNQFSCYFISSAVNLFLAVWKIVWKLTEVAHNKPGY